MAVRKAAIQVDEIAIKVLEILSMSLPLSDPASIA